MLFIFWERKIDFALAFRPKRGYTDTDEFERKGGPEEMPGVPLSFKPVQPEHT